MGTIVAAMRTVEGELKAAGIRATCDPRNLNPPCVLIVPPSILLDSNCGGLATCQAYVVGPGPGNLDAWTTIDTLAEKVGGILNLEQLIPTSYQVDDDSPMPALQVQWTQSVDWPN